MGVVGHTWHVLREGRPGERFSAYHHRHASQPGHWMRIVLAIGFLVVGGVLLLIPGPGIPFVAVGAAMLARESLATARFLDRLELSVRRRVHRRQPATPEK